MDILRKIFRAVSQGRKKIKLDLPAPDENSNRHVLVLCRNERFPEANIRKALVELNGLDAKKLANGVSVTTLYRTLNGDSGHAGAKVLWADSLGLQVGELFKTETGAPPSETPAQI